MRYFLIKLKFMRKYKIKEFVLQRRNNNNNRSDIVLETYSYLGTEVIIITVFNIGIDSIAIVEDINTGEQFEVFKNQLH